MIQYRPETLDCNSHCFLSEDKESFQQKDFDECLQLHEAIQSVDQIKADLMTIVNGHENKLVYVRNICKLYENCFCRKFPYDVSLLNEALESLDKPLEVRLIVVVL